MGKIEHIEQQIAALTAEELAIFRRWYVAFDADAWDGQIQADAASGRLDEFVAEAKAEYKTGKAREL
ncbi:MAG: hypothetical protein ACREPX_09885 [Rhodanobacteraceae bacterium]